MKHVPRLCAVLLALALLLPGGNFLLDLVEIPRGTGSEGERLLQAMRDGGLMWWIALGHVISGALLLFERSRLLGGLVQLPITLGIVAFNVTMFAPGVPLALAMLALNLGALSDVQPRSLLRVRTA